MARRTIKIPDKFRNVVGPILMKNEVVICAFRESFKWDFTWANILPKWLVLTNLRLLILSREIPGVKVDEYHLSGLNIDLFRDSIGLYDSIEFQSGGQLVYQVSVYRPRRREAEAFEREVSEAIAKLDFGQKLSSEPDSGIAPESSAKCALEKTHLKDLERMGAITKTEFEEEVKKPCKK